MGKRDIEAIYELSPQQQGMLFDSLQESGSGIHVEQKIYRLQGDLDVSVMERAWQRLVDRHSILRTAFVWKTQDQLLQVVLRSVVLKLATEDWRDVAEPEQEKKLSAYLDADRSRGFDLSKAPLMRLCLFRMGDRDYRLVWTHHHIILDGWCRPIIDREIRSLYEAFSLGHDLSLPPTRPYRDFIAWLKQQDLTKAESFWRQTLKGITSPTPLGVETDGSGRTNNEHTLGYHTAQLPLAASNALRSFARENHLTVNTIVQGVWGLLLSRYSGRNDVVFGTTVSGRPAELESAGSMIGLFINTLPFRVTVTDGPLLSWFPKLQEQHLEVRHYEFCSTGQIHQWSEVPGAQPLYESIVVFENYPTNPATSSGIVFNPDDAYSIGGQTRHALNILVIDRSELGLYIAYDRNRLEADDVARVVEHIFILLRAIIGNPGQDLKTLLNRIPIAEAPRVARPRDAKRDHWIAPRNPTEEVLARIWTEVLGIERISVDDNFFELKGHSLLATQVFSRIRDAFAVQLPLRYLFESPTIATLAQRIEAVQNKEAVPALPPLTRVSRERPLPLSFAQQRLWFLDQLQPGSPFYNVSMAIRVSGDLKLEALEQALNAIVARHETLRTVFVTVEHEPAQMVLEHQPFAVPVFDLRNLPAADREPAALKFLNDEAELPIDLSKGPMLRASLLRLNDDDFILSLNTHHIVSDGWSMSVLFRELGSFYEASLTDTPPTLPELKIQYADYAVWQRNWLQGDALDRELDHWKRQLAGAPMVLELPLDKPRPAELTVLGAKLRRTLDTELSRAVETLSRQHGVTPFMVLLATFQLLLSRYTGREDLMVGTDLANRTRLETENLIGFFVNLLPVRTVLNGNQKFDELLRRIKEVMLETYAHQDVPFEKIVEAVQPPRDLSRNPLVQVLFVMQNTPHRSLELPGLKLNPFDLGREHSRFDLVLFVWQGTAQLECSWVYNSDLFEPDSIAKMSARFETLLESIISDPGARLADLEMESEQEREKRAVEDMERKMSRSKQMRSARRKAVDLSTLNQISTGYLKSDEKFPLVIQPELPGIDLVEWAGNNQEFLTDNLLLHGAILFRGFNIDSVSEFERFASAICPELFGEYGDLPRQGLGGKVYGSTPYPSDETILFHNESSHMHRWPMLIWFYCVKPSDVGGETPIVDCRKIYQALDPVLRQSFSERGLMYVRNFTPGLDVSWQDFFGTTDRAAVEDYCKQAGIDFEWTSGNGLRTRQICPAVVQHPQTGEMVFFNQLQLHHVRCLAAPVRESLLSMMSEEDLPRNVYYGDGTKIEDSVVDELLALYRANAVTFPWREHDIIMLNNMLVAHSRNPYVGERKIVVALGNVVSNEQMN